LFAQTFLLDENYYVDRDTVYASDLIGAIEEDFVIGEFGTRSSLQFPAARMKRLFEEHNLAVDTAASIITLYRLGGLDLAQLKAALSEEYRSHYPQMRIVSLSIQPQSVSDVSGLELVEIQLGRNQLRRNKGTFQAWYGQGGEGLRRLFFGYEIEAALPVLEASKTIDARTIIDTHNTKGRLMAFERFSSDPIRAEQLGRVTARGRLREGMLITENRVSILPDVRRGKQIRVEMVEGGVRLSFLATAQEDAMIGESLEVEDARGRSFRVRLVEKDRAKVE
jgi:flagella basal body P-ring formation protein FlgA